MFKRTLMLAAVAAGSLCLVACSTPVDTSNWPDPTTVQTTVDGVDAAYVGSCALDKGASWCTKADQAAVAKCHKAADAGVSTYAAAYKSGDVTAAVLTAEGSIVSDLTSCVAKVKKA